MDTSIHIPRHYAELQNVVGPEGTGSELSSWLWQKSSHTFLHCLSWHYAELWNVVGPAWATTTTKGRKLVIRLESDVDSELPLPSFEVTLPGLAAVKVDMFL